LEKKKINGFPHIRYKHNQLLSSDELELASKAFYQKMNKRRSIREFSDREVSKSVIENIIQAAGTAPSGANKQPWMYCAVSNSEIKRQIRQAAEAEEKISYDKRMSDQWLQDLEPLGTDFQKPFLEIAPWLIIAFKKIFDINQEGEKETNYYVNESVGISCGLLISAIHDAGLVTLTHTPSPMNFLSEILNRPKNERAFILFPVGYPADEVYVPDIHRKPLNEISEFYL